MASHSCGSGGGADNAHEPSGGTAAPSQLHLNLATRIDDLNSKIAVLEVEIEQEQRSTTSLTPSLAPLVKKQRVLEMQIKISQAKICQTEVHRSAATTAEQKATLHAEKMALYAQKATLQQEEILLLEAQLQAQAPIIEREHPLLSKVQSNESIGWGRVIMRWEGCGCGCAGGGSKSTARCCCRCSIGPDNALSLTVRTGAAWTSGAARVGHHWPPS